MHVTNGLQRTHSKCCSLCTCSVTGRDTVSSAGVTRLLPPAATGQLHFAQYGGFLQLGNLQLEGRATSTSAASASGGVSIKRSKDGADDGQPATFAALTVTFE
jgi:hypothetical protein